MPIFRLIDDIIFPDPNLADKDGIIAVGGDLSTKRLLAAYSAGIFPWFSDDSPILWWSPDPRFTLFPDKLIISKSMRKLLNKQVFKVTFDNCFQKVIIMCAELRYNDTWITKEMIESYTKLHKLGFAHSVEVWYENNLVGGLYGVSLGKCFFGESMFSIMDNASKVALVKLNELLIKHNFIFIDCQVYTKHLESLGALNIPRVQFLKYLDYGLSFETLRGRWE